MTDVSISFGEGDLIQAAQHNQTNADLVALATQIGTDQIEDGAITFNKLLDRFGLSHDSSIIIPATTGGDLSSPAGLTLPASETRIDLWQPPLKPGWEAYLAAILVYVEEADTGAGTDGWSIDFRRNASTVLGGAAASVSGSLDQRNYLFANNDPIVNPLTSLGDGDYVETRIWGPSGTPEPRGVKVTYAYKHVLVP